jgi:hypothetical protein
MRTVQEWMRTQKPVISDQSSVISHETPLRNPFRKRFWNLTEQMRLQKNDPEFAARLKAEAWAEGD